MAFLSAPNPWAMIFERQAHEWERRIAFEHPQLDPVGLSVTGLVVVAATTGTLSSAYLIAGVLAELWPSWLADLDVALVVEAGDWSVTAPAEVMLARPDLDETLWLLECEVHGG